MGWYHKIKLPVSRAQRVRRYVRGGRGNGTYSRDPITVPALHTIFYKTYSQSMHVNGYKLKLISRSAMAAFFGTRRLTIISWDKAGVLPEPFLIAERGTRDVPLYLTAQIRCLAVVVRDLSNEGYVSIPWAQLNEHIEMLHVGYAEVRKNLYTRMGQRSGPKTYGVEFL